VSLDRPEKADRDVRAKVGDRTKAALESETESSGLTESEVVRDILDRWAQSKIHAAIVLVRKLGPQGTVGNPREDDGRERCVTSDPPR
jgi:hypothetical protein